MLSGHYVGRLVGEGIVLGNAKWSLCGFRLVGEGIVVGNVKW
jgi:hypothetical protein